MCGLVAVESQAYHLQTGFTTGVLPIERLEPYNRKPHNKDDYLATLHPGNTCSTINTDVIDGSHRNIWLTTVWSRKL
jgi:hypothetical protein